LANIAKHSPPGLPLRGFMVTPTPMVEIWNLRSEVTAESLALDHILMQESDYIARILVELKDAVTPRSPGAGVGA